MSAKKGFTLIELLVVIAIITILASIVAPKIYNAMERAKMAKALAEIKNADLALTKMLADTERKHFGHVLAYPDKFDPRLLSYAQAVKMYTAAFYELLRRGKNADLTNLPLDDNDPPLQTVSLTLKSGVDKKLGTSYMDINYDPWRKAYQFYAGPLKLSLDLVNYPYDYPPWRSNNGEGYVYDAGQKQKLDSELRGNPQADGHEGFPCPVDQQVYIFSCGGNGAPNQPWLAPADVEFGVGGGDDINNWDPQSGWSEFY